MERALAAKTVTMTKAETILSEIVRYHNDLEFSISKDIDVHERTESEEINYLDVLLFNAEEALKEVA